MLHLAIELAIMGLIVYLPLASGGVTEVSVMLLEVTCGVLFLAWLVSVFRTPDAPAVKQRRSRRRRSASEKIRQSARATDIFRITIPPFWWTMPAFGLLGLLQFLPLPSGVVRVVSPSTFHLYAEAAATLGEQVPAWMPLSVATQFTETAIWLLAAYMLLFLVIVNVIRTPAQVKRVLTVLMAVGLWEAIAGLSQLPTPRISGTFVNQNHLAGYLGMLIPLACGLLFAQLEARKTTASGGIHKWFDDKYLKTALFLILLTVLFLALIFSGSRGGMLSVSCGVGCLGILAYSRRLLRRWVKVLVACVALIFLLTIFVRPEAVLRRFSALTTTSVENTWKDRVAVWQDSASIVSDFPILGSGVGTFRYVFQRYQTFPSEMWFTHAENDYVQVCAEAGILGIVIVGWGAVAYGTATFRAWKQQRSRWAIAVGAGGLGALCSMAVHSAGDFNLHIPSNALVFTVIAGITYTIAHFQREERPQPAAIPGNPASESGSSLVSRPPVRSIRMSRIGRIGVLLLLTIMVAGGILAVTRSFSAFLASKHFRTILALLEDGYDSEANRRAARLSAEQAIAFDANHADYHFALGSYLYRHARDYGRKGEVDAYDRTLDEAEAYIRKAALLAPPDPWMFYELGNISRSRGECLPQDRKNAPEDASCKALEYYRMALCNAPMNYFLRKTAARWLYEYDQEYGMLVFESLRQHQYGADPGSEAQMLMQMAQLLYDARLDVESDRYAARAGHAAFDADRACVASPLEPIAREADADAGQKAVFGRDDGTAEWRVHLNSDIMRIRKDICLPEDLRGYTGAILKILMNNGANGNFTAQIFLEDHLVKTYSPIDPVPRVAHWYEMPVDIDWLRGRRMVRVYIRVSGVSYQGNYLQVWGDDSAPTTGSVLNFGHTDDLSLHDGIQAGEYMIRLVLQR